MFIKSKSMYIYRISFMAFSLSLLLGVELVFAENQISINRNLLLAESCKTDDSCTYTWTLASRLGSMLEHAEMIYGERDKRYTILGIEFTTDEQPSHWYPGDRGDVLIQLTTEAMQDEYRALFQLSHEVFHLLSPSGSRGNAPVLEEGLAVLFSGVYMDSIGRPVSRSYVSSAKYLAALDLVNSLYKTYPDTNERIKALRVRSAKFADITAADFTKEFPNISHEIVDQLLHSFQSWDGEYDAQQNHSADAPKARAADG